MAHMAYSVLPVTFETPERVDCSASDLHNTQRSESIRGLTTPCHDLADRHTSCDDHERWMPTALSSGFTCDKHAKLFEGPVAL